MTRSVLAAFCAALMGMTLSCAGAPGAGSSRSAAGKAGEEPEWIARGETGKYRKAAFRRGNG